MKTKTLLKTAVLFLLLYFVTACKDNSSTGNTTTTTSTAKATGPYTSKMTKADKKKFFDANNNVVYEIKYKADGFKLRTAASTLLWKVKLYDDKVKISDNEENLNPYEIKILGSYEAKLVKDEENLARTKYDPDSKTQFISTQDATEPETFKTDYSPALLLNKILEIPEDQKQILMKELLAKGF